MIKEWQFSIMFGLQVKEGEITKTIYGLVSLVL